MITVAIMRNKDKKEESVKLAESMGYTVRFASPLELAELDSPKFWKFEEDLETGKVKRAVLTSPTAVKFMLSLLQKKGKASAAVKRLNERGIIAIGPITAEAVKKEWIKAESVPEKFTAEGLADHMKGKIDQGDKVWVVRSDKESEVLVKGLEMAGAKVEEVAVYALQRSDADRALLDMYYWTVNGGIDAYMFTSSMVAEAFIQEGEKKYGVRPFGLSLNESIIVAINEATKNTLERLGIDVDVVPREATFEKMMQALQGYLDPQNQH